MDVFGAVEGDGGEQEATLIVDISLTQNDTSQAPNNRIPLCSCQLFCMVMFDI